MRRIAILNQKGGVGKTTTAVNLAAALAECGQRVCVLDLDPQAHATTHLGIEPDGKAPSMYDVLIDNKPLAEVRRQAEDNLWVAASDINLAAAEGHPASVMDMSFANQSLAAEYISKNYQNFDKKVYMLPTEVDMEIARLKLESMKVAIDALTEEQVKYLSSFEMGT